MNVGKKKKHLQHTYQFHLAGLQTILNMHKQFHNYWEQTIAFYPTTAFYPNAMEGYIPDRNA